MTSYGNSDFFIKPSIANFVGLHNLLQLEGFERIQSARLENLELDDVVYMQ